MPPSDPDPDALDQTMSGFTGSGVAKPLSPPPISLHIPDCIIPECHQFSVLDLLGPFIEGPSCLLVNKLYGILLSVVT